MRRLADAAEPTGWEKKAFCQLPGSAAGFAVAIGLAALRLQGVLEAAAFLAAGFLRTIAAAFIGFVVEVVLVALAACFNRFLNSLLPCACWALPRRRALLSHRLLKLLAMRDDFQSLIQPAQRQMGSVGHLNKMTSADHKRIASCFVAMQQTAEAQHW